MKRRGISTHKSSHWICRGNVFSAHTSHWRDVLLCSRCCSTSPVVNNISQDICTRVCTYTLCVSWGRDADMKNIKVYWLLWCLEQREDRNTGQVLACVHTQTHMWHFAMLTKLMERLMLLYWSCMNGFGCLGIMSLRWDCMDDRNAREGIDGEESNVVSRMGFMKYHLMDVYGMLATYGLWLDPVSSRIQFQT